MRRLERGRKKYKSREREKGKGNGGRGSGKRYERKREVANTKRHWVGGEEGPLCSLVRVQREESSITLQ